MINNTDINAINLSPTAKDYYQAWNELLEIAKKLSLRWDPTTTNESDPGIVLLKVLTAIVDKLNFQTDITALEVFMPSASTLESMQKLCNMMGYNIKYYQSATTDVTLYYSGEAEWSQSSYLIPMFTSFTNSDKSVNYISIEPKYLTKNNYGVSIPCIEGQIEQCESDNDNIISIYQLDDNNRYYFNETQIAQNGIFVFNINDGNKSSKWEEVDNLNSQEAKSKVYKFGFDSKLSKPYIEFPEDISSIIEDGLEIYYTRTSGVNGNISARELSAFVTVPTELSDNLDGDTESYTIVNPSASTNGANLESIPEAYNNYKKTVGTFDTLINCRDYMNKIYQLKDDSNINLVSNCLVSDINNDINHSIKLCTYNDYGIYYKNIQTTEDSPVDNFTLTLYPFKRVNNLNTKAEYLNSFKLDRSILSDIESKLENIKTLSHKFRLPDAGDSESTAEIAAIKNYLQLKAIITTTERVNKAEQSVILSNIKAAIYENFNMHKLDFSEQIPYDSILEVILNADKRIKNVNLDEPTLLTKFLLANNSEYSVASTYSISQSTSSFTGLSNEEQLSRKIYNQLALRNILAGKLELFNYDSEFKSAFTEAKYPTGFDVLTPSKNSNYGLVKLSTSTKYQISGSSTETDKILQKLTTGEIIQFRSKNLRTILTYPAYVNYFIHLNRTGTTDAVPAEFITLLSFANDLATSNKKFKKSLFSVSMIGESGYLSQTDYDSMTQSMPLFTVYDSNNYVISKSWSESDVYYSMDISTTTNGTKNFNNLLNLVTGISITGNIKYSGIYKCVGTNKLYRPGYLVDESSCKYVKLNFAIVNGSWTNYFVQRKHTNQHPAGDANNYFLGVDAVLGGIKKNAEYELKTGEFLLINYTKSETDTESSSSTEQIINEYYGPGTIIKPNFALKDSIESYQNGSTYTKTDVDFKDSITDAGASLTETTYSLFTLGTNEQIEIREFSNVYLDSDVVYLYWNLNNSSNQLRLKYESKTTSGNFSVITHSYILGENEYLYYSDQNQLDMAYYGNGTKVSIQQTVLSSDAYITTEKYKEDKIFNISDKTVNNETILSEGLKSIPWVKFNFNSKDIVNNAKTFMFLTEYKYINLIEGDYISAIDLETSSTSDSSSNKFITNEWSKIKNGSTTSYYSNGTYCELDNLDFTEDKNCWEVTSKLVLNCGPDLNQILANVNDSVIAYLVKNTVINSQVIEPYNEDGTDIKTSIDNILAGDPGTSGNEIWKSITIKKSTPSSENVNLKSNYELRNAYGDIYTLVQTTDSDTGEETFIYDFKMKTTKINNLTTALNSSLNQSLHNVSNNLTRFAFSEIFNNRIVTKNLDYDPTNDYVNLSLLLNNDNSQYGMVMIYYMKNQTTKENAKNVAITLSDRSGALNPVIFGNFMDGNKKVTTIDKAIPANLSWWTDLNYSINSDVYYQLKPGINILYIPNSATLNIYPDIYPETTGGTTTWKLKCEDSIIISDLSLINKTDSNKFGINLDLLHYYITTSSSQSESNIADIGQQLLLDISKIDTNNEFYYNSSIDNNNAIDINTDAIDVNGDYESLQSPNIWYNKNNLNNPYVISEIDIKSVDTNIQIARSSIKN